ncbi:hypothetical protein ACIBG5_42235 [Kribbella sp. NPDC050241]|uniref:hypothetical protein n=1 Tax=Kribbella sp. NPDC050241 TaxID=3364115 RepID=UPI003794F3CD
MNTYHSPTADIATADPATIAFIAMKEQAERFGYAVAVWTGDPMFAAPVEVDHEAQTVAVDGDADPASRAVGLVPRTSGCRD